MLFPAAPEGVSRATAAYGPRGGTTPNISAGPAPLFLHAEASVHLHASQRHSPKTSLRYRSHGLPASPVMSSSQYFFICVSGFNFKIKNSGVRWGFWPRRQSPEISSFAGDARPYTRRQGRQSAPLHPNLRLSPRSLPRTRPAPPPPARPPPPRPPRPPRPSPPRARGAARARPARPRRRRRRGRPGRPRPTGLRASLRRSRSLRGWRGERRRACRSSAASRPPRR
mmetsp:Transcript_11490/g.37608  ORF Transcript_11490/g.37608 Transcript_11490/m.37608 type:complete len:226 (-) Transcript_11490:608-1285(-)